MERIITLFKLDRDILTDEDKARALLKKMPSRIASAKKSTTLEGQAKAKRVNMLSYLMFGLKVKYGIQVKANQKKFDAVREEMKSMGKAKAKPEPEEEDSSSDEEEITFEDAINELEEGDVTGDRKRLLEAIAVGGSEEDMKFFHQYEGYAYQKGTGLLRYVEPTQTMYGYWELIAGGGADLGQEYVESGGGFDRRTEDPNVYRLADTFSKAVNRNDPLTLTGWGYKDLNWSGGFNERPPKWVTDMREERKRLKTIADAKEPSVDELTEAVSAVKLDPRSDFEKFKDLPYDEKLAKDPQLTLMLDKYRASEEGEAKIDALIDADADFPDEERREVLGDYKFAFKRFGYGTAVTPAYIKEGNMGGEYIRESYGAMPDIYGTEEEFQEGLDRAVTKPHIERLQKQRDARRETRAERMGEFTGERVKAVGEDGESILRPFRFKDRDYLALITSDDEDEGQNRMMGMGLYFPNQEGEQTYVGQLVAEDSDDDFENEDKIFNTPRYGGRAEFQIDYDLADYSGDEEEKFFANEFKGRRARDTAKTQPDRVGTMADLGFEVRKHNTWEEYGWGSLILDGKRYYTSKAHDLNWDEEHESIVRVYEVDEDELEAKLQDEKRGGSMSSYEIMRNDYIGEFDTATMSYVKYEDRVTERDVVGMPDSDDSDWEDWIRERRDKIYRRDNAKVNLAEKAKRQVFIDQMKAGRHIKRTP